MKEQTARFILNDFLEKDLYWEIRTNIPVGLGLNGVEYLYFTNAHYRNKDTEKSSWDIRELNDDYMVLDSYEHGSYVYLDYENITLINTQSRFYDYKMKY